MEGSERGRKGREGGGWGGGRRNTGRGEEGIGGERERRGSKSKTRGGRDEKGGQREGRVLAYSPDNGLWTLGQHRRQPPALAIYR